MVLEPILSYDYVRLELVCCNSFSYAWFFCDSSIYLVVVSHFVELMEEITSSFFNKKVSQLEREENFQSWRQHVILSVRGHNLKLIYMAMLRFHQHFVDLMELKIRIQSIWSIQLPCLMVASFCFISSQLWTHRLHDNIVHLPKASQRFSFITNYYDNAPIWLSSGSETSTPIYERLFDLDSVCMWQLGKICPPDRRDETNIYSA